MDNPKLLEFFAGTQSISKVARTRGWETFTTDVNKRFKTDYTVNFLNFDLDRLPWIPDAVHGSPPCTFFSIASMHKHWKREGHEWVPQTQYAVCAVILVQRFLETLEKLRAMNPDLIVTIENPAGMMNKLELIPSPPYTRHEITYCSYNDDRYKPTHIWTNDQLWQPRPKAGVHDGLHVKNATLSRNTSAQRSTIPEELCMSLIESWERNLKGNIEIPVVSSTAKTEVVEELQKPFESYHGGKGSEGVYQTIINKIPYHDVFVSACLGNGSIMRKKKPASLNIGIDADPDVISRWKEFPMFSYKILHAQFQEWISEDFPSMYREDLKYFIFIDPPYPVQVRKTKRAVYKHEMMSSEEHLSLLDLLKNVASKYKNLYLMICSYPNQLYDQALPNWKTHRYQGRTRAGVSNEILYMNYEDPMALHQYNYLGQDNRQRERLNKRVARNVKRLKEMDALERNAILSAILQSEELVGPNSDLKKKVQVIT